MKNQTSGKAMFIALGVTALLWAVPAGAQDSRMRMDIPFPFVAGDRVLPAGAYWVTVDRDFHRCRLDGLSNSTVQLILLSTATDSLSRTKVEKGTLRFTRYGGQHFLSHVWRPGQEEGSRVVTSKRLLEAAKVNAGDAGPTVTTVVSPN